MRSAIRASSVLVVRFRLRVSALGGAVALFVGSSGNLERYISVGFPVAHSFKPVVQVLV